MRAISERRIVRVLVDNELLLKGLKLEPTTVLIQIVPAVDRFSFGMSHWLFFASPDFPVNTPGCIVPDYIMKFTDNADGGSDVTMEAC